VGVAIASRPHNWTFHIAIRDIKEEEEEGEEEKKIKAFTQGIAFLEEPKIYFRSPIPHRNDQLLDCSRNHSCIFELGINIQANIIFRDFFCFIGLEANGIAWA